MSGLEQSIDDKSKSRFLGLFDTTRSKLHGKSRVLYVAYVRPKTTTELVKVGVAGDDTPDGGITSPPKKRTKP